ncbi:MAG: hypothetical protein WB624_06610 [Xanthobacteraceae bacterium]|jgi:hypothetical protein
MKLMLIGGLVCLAVVAFFIVRSGAERTVSLDVEFKLTDLDYHPLAGVPLRLVVGAKDRQSPDAGVRFVTAADGSAKFTTQALINRRWNFSNIGFTPFSIPFRADHIAVAAELPFVLPKKGGDDIVHRWLYTADIDRMPDGDCSTDDLDDVYEAGVDGRFSKLIGTGAAGPNFNTVVDGWVLSGAGYQLWEFMLEPDKADTAGQHWHLKLAIKRRSRPVLPEG